MFRSRSRIAAKSHLGEDWGCKIAFITLLRLLVSTVFRIKIIRALNTWRRDELVTKRQVVVL